MSDLRALYQEVILDHYKRPRNFGSLEDPDRTSEGYNPLCGDQVKVGVKLDGDRIDEIAFDGVGCAISTASASLMTEAVKGKTVEEASKLMAAFHASVTGDVESSDVPLGKLEALLGVRDYPVRIKCATLAWHALRAVLEARSETVSTE